MKRTVLIIAALLSTLANVQAKPRAAHVSRCIAQQRAALAPLDRYGGRLPSFAPAIMQQVMNPLIARMRVHCFPRSNAPADPGWDVNSPTIAAPPAYEPPPTVAPPPPAYEPSANNPVCPGSIC